MVKITSLRAASLRDSLIASLALTALILVLLAISALLSGTGLQTAARSVEWLAALQREDAADKLSDTAQVIAGVLGIAITVVALVLQLAATRSGHQIIPMFIHEPVNRIVLSLFVLTLLLCLWVTVTIGHPDQAAILPSAGFAITMALVTISLLILLPYFIFVFSFLSPLNLIECLQKRAGSVLSRATRGAVEADHSAFVRDIDELQDVARSAIEQGDRAVAIACIDALAGLMFDYRRLRAALPAEWFRLSDVIRRDPDFVSLAPPLLDEIEDTSVWFEFKVLRQYRELLSNCLPRAHDVADMIAINTGRIGVAAAADHPELITQCMRCFNTYLRTTIRASDMRTGVNVLNQYRLMAEALLAHGRLDAVREVAGYFKFYGSFAHRERQSFLLEVAAHDLVRLIESAAIANSPVVDDLLSLLLELDQEIKQDSQESSLIGVRRAQIQLGTFFIERGEEAPARRIAADLASEQRERLERIRMELLGDQSQQYWEFTPRGFNFSYLAPERRRHLATLFGWLANP